MQQTVEIPQLQFICVVVDLPVVTHMPSLMVQTSRRTIEIPQVIRGLHAAGELAERVCGSRLGGNSLLDYAVLCVAMSSGGESFSPDDAYDSAWDSVMPTKGNTLFITSSTKTLLGVFACSRTGSAAVAFFAPTTTTTSSPI